MWFKALSRLRVNLLKSEIMLVGRVAGACYLASLRVQGGLITLSYLVLPLGSYHQLKAVWDCGEERFMKKLSYWKRNCISIVGDYFQFVAPY